MVNVNAAKTDRNQIKILVVEDDVTTAHVAKALCESFDCQVQVALNAMEALELYEQWAADMVLLDLQLPEIGGFEAAFELRLTEAELERPPLRIIAVTGTAEVQDIYLRCIANGMNDCMAKPYTPEMVESLLERYFGEGSPDVTLQEGLSLPRSAGSSI